MDNPDNGIFGRLRRMLDRFLSGSAPTDPLYLSNRTFDQVFKRWLLVALPLVLVAAGAVVVFRTLRPSEPPPAKVLTNAEIAAKMLPNLDQKIEVEGDKDLVVEDVHVDHAAEAKLAGTVRNTTHHEIRSAEIVFTVTAANGVQLSAVRVQVTGIPAGATVPFQTPVVPNAAFAIVREVHSQ